MEMETMWSSLRKYFNEEPFCSFMRKCIFRVLSVGPIPNHIAFIMDGNRRYAWKCNLNQGAGHEVGFLVLMSMLKYCYELGVKYVTTYAFSIDNFRRKPQEVEFLMDLMEDKLESLLAEESFLNIYGIRIYFAGNLQLLREPVRLAAEKAIAATAKNDKAVLFVCVAYSSTDEIMHAVQEACYERRTVIQKLSSNDKQNDKECSMKLAEMEQHMYMAVAPDPDILIRTSGETRLSNFLLWQTSCCYLYSPCALWPELSFWHLLWGVLKYQCLQPYLEKKKKQL